MTLLIPGIPQSIGAIVQDRTLERMFHDAAYPNLLWRAEAAPDKWTINLGETQLCTRVGLMDADVDPIDPGNDPTIGSYGKEQWRVTASQYGKTIPTYMPASAIAIASLVLRDAQQLGLHAGQTMNRVPRNRLMAAYGGGDTVVKTAALANALAVHVASLSGFGEQLQDAQLLPVSPVNPLAVTFTNTEPANTIVGVIPDNPKRPLGSGMIVFGAALSVGLPARTGVRAGTRSPIYRVGAGATVDGISTANVLTPQDIINVVSGLRARRMPPHADGTYHVHLEPTAEAQLFGDNALQRMYQSIPDAAPFRDLILGRMWGCTFYRNTEMPTAETITRTDKNGVSLVQANAGGNGAAWLAQEMGLEIVNANGVAIKRTMVTGGGLMVEKYLDESNYITEAGVTGKIGSFSIINGGLAIMLDRIRFIMAAPLDALQQTIRQSWSWSGDFGIPSDAIVGTPARFKRATLIEHG